MNSRTRGISPVRKKTGFWETMFGKQDSFEFSSERGISPVREEPGIWETFKSFIFGEESDEYVYQPPRRRPTQQRYDPRPRREQRYDQSTYQRYDPRREQRYDQSSQQRYDPRPRREQRYDQSSQQRYDPRPRREQRYDQSTYQPSQQRYDPRPTRQERYEPIFTDSEIDEINQIYATIDATIIQLKELGLVDEIEKLRIIQQEMANSQKDKQQMIDVLSNWQNWQNEFLEWQANQQISPEFQEVYDEILASILILEQLGEPSPELIELKNRFEQGDVTNVAQSWDKLKYFEILRKSCAGKKNIGILPNKEICRKILGVSQDATKSQIKKAYIKFAKKHHPDKGGDKKMFDAIVTAKDVLLN
jgi:hypothetical protein